MHDRFVNIINMSILSVYALLNSKNSAISRDNTTICLSEKNYKYFIVNINIYWLARKIDRK